MTEASEATEVSPAADPAQPAGSEPVVATRPASRQKERAPLQALVGAIGSFGLTCIILLGLMVLTYFGTYTQIEIGLAAAQREYFNSWGVFINVREFVPEFFPDFAKTIFWPGGMLLICMLSANLLVGGIVRLRWRQRTVGILIIHFGIVGLLVSSLITYVTSTRGSLSFYEGEQSSTYVSFDEWELVVQEPRGDGTVREFLVADSTLASLPLIQSDDLPFEIVVHAFYVNSDVRAAQTTLAIDAVDGVILTRELLDSQSPANVPGARIEVRGPGQPTQLGIVWGAQRFPLTVQVNGAPWTIDLRRQVFDVPFALRLEEFTKEDHPRDAATNSAMPRFFSSDVTMLSGGVEQPFHIAMNEPMRYMGYMFSQNSWGPATGIPPLYSVLEVATNPSDRWPAYACGVIALGMLLHFGRKLYQHVQKQKRSLSA